MEPNKKFGGIRPLPTVTGGHIKAFYHTYGTTSPVTFLLATCHRLYEETSASNKTAPTRVDSYMKCHEQ
jgi:hypothetical protein